MNGIRERIVQQRRARVAVEGHTLGAAVPARRSAPVAPFLRDPPIICEIKRRSPSRGDISAGLDPVAQAGRYAEQGVRSLSILTEEDYFAGSLADLVAVKSAYPDLAVLRKDFLLDREDIEVSYRAGADAVLLIASILSAGELAELHAAARRLGMEALVEVHDEEDIARARAVKPPLVGINARDLSTFAVDLLTPMRVRHRITWEHRAVFESGVFGTEHGRLAASGGFAGLLVGEAVVREPDRIPNIVAGFTGPRAGVMWSHPSADFWCRLAGRMDPSRSAGSAGGKQGNAAASAAAAEAAEANAGEEPVPRPLVKICGITNREDAEAAVRFGADVLGFVLADSPRRVEPGLLRELADMDVLKAAVVVTGGRHGELSDRVGALLADGVIDVIQFHGDETPAECVTTAFPYYRALRLGAAGDAGAIGRYGCPRVLVDARSEEAYGGTGRRLSPELVAAAAEQGPLWLAGGMDDRNVGEAVRTFRPELIDASSGLEREPGRKDHRRLTRFFETIRRETADA